MWSASVVLLFIMLSDTMPFSEVYTVQPMATQIATGTISFRSRNWTTVSEPAKDLITNLIIVDATKRLSADDAKHHAWLKDPVMLQMAHDLMGFVDAGDSSRNQN